MPRLISTSGTVRAWQQLPIGAETSGVAVTELFVDEGDAVRRGQPLAQLNDRVLRAQMAQQEAAVAEARATSVEAQTNLVRAEEMRRRDATSAQNLDARKAAAATSAARLAVAEATRAETASRLAQMRILAPADGYVSARKIEIGEVVSAGQQLFEIVRDGRLELDAEVPETDLAGLQEGQLARVLTDGGGEIEAHVRAVAPSIDSRTRLGVVHLALPADSGLRPGMYARAEIALGDAPALVVPQSAVVWRDGRAGCFVVDRDGRAVFRAVQTGARVAGAVEIRSGVAAGDRVALAGAGFLEDGDRVHVADDTAGGAADPGGIGG
jgi:RND family efflux transporter MFP subunit